MCRTDRQGVSPPPRRGAEGSARGGKARRPAGGESRAAGTLEPRDLRDPVGPASPDSACWWRCCSCSCPISVPATNYWESWHLNRETRAEVQNLREDNARLRERARALDRPQRVELEARRLGMARPGERVYVVHGLPQGR